MKYFEIKNTKTGREFTATANRMREACEINGEKVRDCKCIYSAKIEKRG